LAAELVRRKVEEGTLVDGEHKLWVFAEKDNVCYGELLSEHSRYYRVRLFAPAVVVDAAKIGTGKWRVIAIPGDVVRLWDNSKTRRWRGKVMEMVHKGERRVVMIRYIQKVRIHHWNSRMRGNSRMRDVWDVRVRSWPL
jgi:hypothetical protein